MHYGIDAGFVAEEELQTHGLPGARKKTNKAVSIFSVYLIFNDILFVTQHPHPLPDDYGCIYCKHSEL